MKQQITHSAKPDQRNNDIHIYINGNLVPKAEATVSVYDSGFLLGDGVWEGLRLHNGRWLFLNDHLDRLFMGARAIGLDLKLTRQQILNALEQTRIKNDMTNDVHARVMVTRGVKTRPFQHPAYSQSGPTFVIIMEHSLVDAPKAISLATVSQIRGLPNAQDPKINSHSKLNCVLAAVEAERLGADEALMLDVNGFVNTTNACNFFIVTKGQLWTSSGDYCINGVTRDKVIQIAKQCNIAVFEKNYSLAQAYAADEAFITGTFAGIVAVATIDGHRIGNGSLGTIGQQLLQGYQTLCRAD